MKLKPVILQTHRCADCNRRFAMGRNGIVCDDGKDRCDDCANVKRGFGGVILAIVGKKVG